MFELKNKQVFRGLFRTICARPCDHSVAGTLLAAAMLGITAVAGAQVNPERDWRTIKTERFYIHYEPQLEELARRTAVQAESAYVALSRYMRPPRGKIDVIIGDNFDLPNGYATPHPSNRIGLYAASHIFVSNLRFTDDHIELVLIHELAHIFHLDRARGWWGAAQKIFGRYPFFFPNLYQPTWLIEGLATFYESRITGAGRIEGSAHDMIARSAAIGHRFPRIDQLSAANPLFPFGYITYAYGSLFLDHVATTHGDSAISRYVEASSRRILPWTLNGPARRAFGESFTSAYRRWSDSLVRSVGASPWTDPIPGWRDLTVHGAFAQQPRWVNDSVILYTGTSGREAYGAYRLTFDPSEVRRDNPRRERLARRHSRSPNVVLSNGDLLYSQVQYDGIYDLRSDLYVDRARGGTRRLTRNARIALPDARTSDDLIVAAQLVSGGSRIVLVSRDGRVITPITSGGIDESWTEPRWSPDGRHIAAIRWTHGGTSAVVILDTAGRAVQTIAAERAVIESPSWSPDGQWVYFDSDRDGLANLYRARFAPRHSERSEESAPPPSNAFERVSNALTGLFEAQVSPSGRQLAAVVFKADGYHIGVAPLDSVRGTPTQPITAAERRTPVTGNQTPVASSKYSAWRQLRPRYWFPFITEGLDSLGTRYGVVTSSEDIAGRHAYDASFAVPDDGSGLTGALFYRNATLGRPILDFYYSQNWENRFYIPDTNNTSVIAGTLRRRVRDASVSLYFPRPRARSFSYLNLGLGYEARDYEAAPRPAIGHLAPFYRSTLSYPRVIVSAGWGNAQRPLLSISAEDGMSAASTLRFRWRSSPAAIDPATGERLSTLTASSVSSFSLYKSLNLPGFAHHVIAARGAVGVQDNRGADYFEAGGVSGGVLDVLPGYALGEGRRSFFVRGFRAATLNGMRAFQGSAEYRAPLRLPGRGVGTWPLFLDRMSVTAFGDVASAWCPGTFAPRPAPASTLCTATDVAFADVLSRPDVIASAGGELNFTAAVLTWDAPIWWRAGFAVPLVAPAGIRTPEPSAYVTVGVSF